jgi:hypothetical protein
MTEVAAAHRAAAAALQRGALSPELAHFGHGAMSAPSPLSGVKRKSDLRAISSAFDPGADMTRANLLWRITAMII